MKPNVDLSLVEEMLAKTREEVDKMTPVNVMVVGKTGVGKSTLINSIFRENLATTGVGKPVTKHLQKITKEGVPMSLVDTRGLELNLASQQEIIAEILQTIATEKQKGIREQVHVVYYCIQAMTSRIEDPEIDLITKLSQQAPVIIVLTQSLGTQAEEFKQYLMNMHLPVQAVLNVMAQPYPIYGKVSAPAFGLMDLLEVTYDVVPREVGAALTNVQQIDINRKAKKARFWATKYIASTFGVGFVPIPFSDAAIIVPMQVTMLAHITSIFGMEMDKATMTALVSVVGGTGGATFAGKFITSNLLKLVPGVGTVAGGVISGVTASMITTALAMSYIEVLVVMARNEQKGKDVNPKEITKLLKLKLSQRIKQGGNQLVKELVTNATNKDGAKGKKATVTASAPIPVRSHKDKAQALAKRWRYKAGELALVVSQKTLVGASQLAEKTTDALERYQQQAQQARIVDKETEEKNAINNVDKVLAQDKQKEVEKTVDSAARTTVAKRTNGHKSPNEVEIDKEIKREVTAVDNLVSKKEIPLENRNHINKTKNIQVGHRTQGSTSNANANPSVMRKVKVLERVAKSMIEKQWNKHHRSK